MRIRIGYPDEAAEREILRASSEAAPDKMRCVVSGEELLQLQDAVAALPVDDSLLDYILGIVKRTREHESLSMGVSPRGAQALYKAAQAMAALDSRDYVTPDDVKRMVLPVFAHRVMVSTRAVIGKNSMSVAEKILEEILTLVAVPL